MWKLCKLAALTVWYDEPRIAITHDDVSAVCWSWVDAVLPKLIWTADINNNKNAFQLMMS